jgi:coproporphyrinogen III oxidase-like Fe-S oxidoreductase
VNQSAQALKPTPPAPDHLSPELLQLLQEMDQDGMIRYTADRVFLTDYGRYVRDQLAATFTRGGGTIDA